MSDSWIDAIMERQKRLKITDTEMCAEAGVHPSTWWRLRRGKGLGQIGTRKRLEAGLERLARRRQAAEAEGAAA